MRYTLIDGETRSAEHPDTFHLPSVVERESLQPGDFAKVGAEFDPEEPPLNIDAAVRPAAEERLGEAWGERFWVLVHAARNGEYEGEVNNELAHTRHHGLYIGAPIQFEPRHVLAIWRRDEEASNGS